MGELAALEGEAYGDEQRTEVRTLTGELDTLEEQYRAAVIAEGEKRRTDPQRPPDGETRELRELRGRVRLADYLDACKTSAPVRGAALEYNQALSVAPDRFPLELLAPAIEERATTDTDGGVTAMGWIDRVFSETAAQAVGVSFVGAAPGMVAYPVTTAGASPAQRGRTQDAVDAPWTVGVTSIEPTRNSVRAVFSRTDALRLPGLEEALRRDLRAALVEGIDRRIFVGDATADETVGDIVGLQGAGITEFTLTQTAKESAETVLTRFVTQIDGQFASSMADLRIVASIPSYRLWETKIHAATIENETIAQFLRRAGLTWTTRGNLATTTNANAYGAYVGLANGIENAAVAAVWADAEMIRDPYSSSASSQVAISLHTHWGFKVARSDNFKRLKYVA